MKSVKQRRACTKITYVMRGKAELHTSQKATHNNKPATHLTVRARSYLLEIALHAVRLLFDNPYMLINGYQRALYCISGLSSPNNVSDCIFISRQPRCAHMHVNVDHHSKKVLDMHVHVCVRIHCMGVYACSGNQLTHVRLSVVISLFCRCLCVGL